MNKIDEHYMKEMSPMYLGPINKDVWDMYEYDFDCLLFENYWQYSKIFPEIKGDYKEWQQKGFLSKKGHRHPKGTKTDQVKFIDSRSVKHIRIQCKF